MNLGYVILYVKDILETVDFYEKAFNLKRRFIHESGAYAEMETGTTALSFVDEKLVENVLPFRPNRLNEQAAGIEISLITQEVQHQYEIAIKAGAVPVMQPVQKPWGQLVSYVRDNNGCLVEICSPMNP